MTRKEGFRKPEAWNKLSCLVCGTEFKKLKSDPKVHCSRECARITVSKKTRNTPADYHKLAEVRGFRWLGHEVRNNKTPTEWKCKEGHTWNAHYNNIQQGHGCMECVRGPGQRSRQGSGINKRHNIDSDR